MKFSTTVLSTLSPYLYMRHYRTPIRSHTLQVDQHASLMNGMPEITFCTYSLWHQIMLHTAYFNSTRLKKWFYLHSVMWLLPAFDFFFALLFVVGLHSYIIKHPIVFWLWMELFYVHQIACLLYVLLRAQNSKVLRLVKFSFIVCLWVSGVLSKMLSTDLHL